MKKPFLEIAPLAACQTATTETPNGVAQSQDFEFAALHEAYFYPHAIISEFYPYLGKSIIEVGAGIGQLTTLLAERVKDSTVTAVEPDAKFASIFRERCPCIDLIEGTVTSIPPDTKCDSIVSVNVIEHIRDHEKEIALYKEILAPQRGHLCILTPAHPELYAEIDKDFGHFRRYTKASMAELLLSAGFESKSVYYFNFPGYFAWLLTFKVLKRRTFNPIMVRLYDRLIFRLSYLAERKLLRPPIGQSIVAIAQA